MKRLRIAIVSCAAIELALGLTWSLTAADKPTAVKPTAVKPTAVKPTAVKPTAVKPIAVKPIAVKTTAAASSGSADTAVRPAAAKASDVPNITAAEAAKAVGANSKPRDFLVGCKPGDVNQWAGAPDRNNVSSAKNLPIEWNVGDFDKDWESGVWKSETAKNIKWVARVGSETYGNPVVADGKVFIGTNNGAAHVKRYPVETDLGCLLCFNEADGKFLWQHSNEKLPTGRVNDWPNQGICSTPLVEGKRCYYVSSRGEVCCLDTEGFLDGKDDGIKDDVPNRDGKKPGEDEADVIWKLNMMKELGVEQHNMCACSVTAVGDLLFVITGNGVDDAHARLPAVRAPSFLAINKHTGKLVWSDNSPGANVLHGQWSSPSYAVVDGVPQVLFAGGDGWLYSFKGTDENDHGKPILLWKFDCNPKDSVYKLVGATRNHLIGTPVWYQGKVFIGVGEDPEHGEGDGHLWCIDPTKHGDVSTEIVVNLKDPKTPVPHRRELAVLKDQGEVVRPNPNSAAVWHYTGGDLDGDGKLSPEETMHRTVGSVAIKDDILYIADLSGIFHCLDAKTGKPYWTHDMLAEAWASPLIADGKVYIGNADGQITIFEHAKKKEIISEVSMGAAVFGTPVFANDVLYIANRNYLFAIQAPKK